MLKNEINKNFVGISEDILQDINGGFRGNIKQRILDIIEIVDAVRTLFIDSKIKRRGHDKFYNPRQNWVSVG
ncbi:MAG: hypothetical protein J6Y29_05800 [Clostridiales bacterium]|nr:hypothetical protein [Clostridiales bacterium]